MSTIIGLKELRENTKHYIAETRKGRSFVVLQRSKPVFRITPADEWGDEGVWETVVDFTKIRSGGVPTSEILAVMERMQKKNESHRKISRKAK
ncbi:MAG TPA: type II toxin-antitoxin system prevent-host-death family antitoxin [Candidatus Paceibacterota bacterium]